MTTEPVNKKLYFYVFIVSILSVSVIVLSTLLINLANTAESLAVSLIDRTTDEAKVQLDNYFDKVKGSLIATKQLCDQGILDAVEIKNINSYLLPVFNTYPEINTIVVANSKGNEYSMIREDSTWLSNVVFESADSGMTIKRERWKGNIHHKEVLREWTDYNADYDPRTRPWFTGAMETEYPDEPWWTEPYIFFTHQIPGITASMRSYCPSTRQTNIIEYDILLSEISEYTTSEHVSENSKTFVMTNDLKVIGLPNEAKFSNPDSISKYVLKEYNKIGSEVVEHSVNRWKGQVDAISSAYTLDIDNVKWWVRISRFEMGKNRLFLIGVAVPEDDFLSEVNSSRNVVIGGFLIVLIIILIVVKQYIAKRKTNLLLAQQKEQIAKQRDEISAQHEVVVEQKLEITDSIDYAKNIQQAILPHAEDLEEILPAHFVLFLPKDVVSGDFYWARKIGDTTLYCAADCTGHGVPGALMSMLCSSQLNEAISENGAATPAALFYRVRKGLISHLQQTGKGQKDGMDAILCALTESSEDGAKAKLSCACANNPLFIVRESTKTNLKVKTTKDGESEDHELEPVLEDNGLALFEIKADKQPVGILFGEQLPFTNHEVILDEGDLIYTISDGFQDQFGGPKGKKFMIKRLKKLFLEIGDKELAVQKEMLFSTLEEWKANPDQPGGEAEQVDDVLVIGVRV